MAFPFDYSGVIVCESILGSNVESLQRTFMKGARERFERAHSDVEIYGSEMHFTASRFSMHPALLGSGKIILHAEEGMITYYISFIDGIIITSVASLGIFGCVFIFVANGPLLGRVTIVAFVWLVMIVAVRLTAISRFKKFVNTLVS